MTMMATFSSGLIATPRGPSLEESSREIDLALDQELAVEGGEAVHVQVRQIEPGAWQGRDKIGLDLGLLAAAGAVAERKIRDVAGQANA